MGQQGDWQPIFAEDQRREFVTTSPEVAVIEMPDIKPDTLCQMPDIRKLGFWIADRKSGEQDSLGTRAAKVPGNRGKACLELLVRGPALRLNVQGPSARGLPASPGSVCLPDRCEQIERQVVSLLRRGAGMGFCRRGRRHVELILCVCVGLLGGSYIHAAQQLPGGREQPVFGKQRCI